MSALTDARTIPPYSIDSRSAKNLAKVQPQVAVMAKLLLARAHQRGICARVISGLRTFEEQDKIYEQGRSLPGIIVTTKKGGYSNHNFGLAFDIGIFQGKDFLSESPNYAVLGPIGESLGLTWGGRWKHLPDEPHFELRPSWAKDITDEAIYLAELRQRIQNQKDLFA